MPRQIYNRTFTYKPPTSGSGPGWDMIKELGWDQRAPIPSDVDKLKEIAQRKPVVEETNEFINLLLANENALPAVIGLFGFGFAYYLAMNPDVFKSFFAMVGSLPPESLSLQAEAL